MHANKGRAEKSRTAESPGTPQTAGHPRSYNVLLVEDEGLIARDIAQRVKSLGHCVTSIVSTAEEAVEGAREAEIVLMDIRLDGPMDGIQAAQIIRERYRIPVVFLTAHSDRATVERAKKAEPFGYIVKPVAPAALHTSLEIAMYKHAAERQIAEREAWLTAVLGSVADAVAVADVEGRVRILNPSAQALTGWSEAEAVGQPLEQIVPLAAERVEASLEGGGARREEPQRIPLEAPVPLAMLRDAAVPLGRDAQLVARTGRTVPVEGTAAPVRVGEGAIGVVLSFRDVGHRRWEEEQLRQSQKVEAAARLAAGVAGEYTSLLTIIRTQAERMVEQFADYSPARTSAEEIRTAAAAADRITRKLAGFAMRQPGRPEVISPNGVLRRMAKLLETVAGAGISVVVRPDQHAGKIKVNEGQFEQLLMNLTMQAGRLSAEGGEVCIETGSPAGELQGAPRGCLRIGVRYLPKAEGAGDAVSVEDESLALSVAHNIAAEHEGFFSVHRGADGWSCLEVLLPRWTEPKAAGSTIAPALTHAVLLVEPREIVRAELHKFFEAHGYNLIEAANAAEAITLAEIRDGTLDLVIAPRREAEQIKAALLATRPHLALLTIVEEGERSAGELRRPYTQAALLERVRGLLTTVDEEAVKASALAEAAATEATQTAATAHDGAGQVQSPAAGE
jgi:CheY-like chemotaxis protein